MMSEEKNSLMRFSADWAQEGKVNLVMSFSKLKRENKNKNLWYEFPRFVKMVKAIILSLI